jgi:hypothetical protein
VHLFSAFFIFPNQFSALLSKNNHEIWCKTHVVFFNLTIVAKNMPTVRGQLLLSKRVAINLKLLKIIKSIWTAQGAADMLLKM